MTFGVEVLGPRWAAGAADHIARRLPRGGSVVLTGGTTAASVYPDLARQTHDWSRIDVYFSDERCVPPDHEASNFAMVEGLLLADARPKSCVRMKGELDPEAAAAEYDLYLLDPVAAGFDLVLLGMGSDGHICAMFPTSPAVHEESRLCLPVGRPDGLAGLTLTPPALASAKTILMLVAGGSKAATVKRALEGDDPPDRFPVRMLAEHPDVTFLLDEDAAALLP